MTRREDHERKAMKAESLEQTGAIEMILYLMGKKQVKWTKILEALKPTSQGALENARDILLEEHIIYEEDLIGPMRRTFTLTETGEKIARFLVEIDKVMQGV